MKHFLYTLTAAFVIACTCHEAHGMVPMDAAPAGIVYDVQGGESAGHGMVYSFAVRARGAGNSNAINGEIQQAIDRAEHLGDAYEYEVTATPGGWRTVTCQRIPFWRRGPFIAALGVAASLGTGYLLGSMLPQ